MISSTSLTEPNIRPIPTQNSSGGELGTSTSGNAASRAPVEIRVPSNGAGSTPADQQTARQGTDSSENIEQIVTRAVSQANNSALSRFTTLKVSTHEGTGRIIVRVYDRDSEELIREIPPERVLYFAASLQEMTGLVVDDRA